MKTSIFFAAACLGIVIWHFPTAVDCAARGFAGSYTMTEGGAEPAPMSSQRVRRESAFDTVVPAAVVPAPPSEATSPTGAPSAGEFELHSSTNVELQDVELQFSAELVASLPE